MVTTLTHNGGMMDYNDMSHEGRELSLYIENTVGFYNHAADVEKNLAKKWLKGTYDLDLGIKAFRHVADAAAKQYHLEHGSMSSKWSDIFSVKDRNQVAEFLALDFVGRMRSGEGPMERVVSDASEARSQGAPKSRLERP